MGQEGDTVFRDPPLKHREGGTAEIFSGTGSRSHPTAPLCPLANIWCIGAMVKPKRFLRPLLAPVALLLTATSTQHLGAEANPGLRSIATGRVAPSPPAPEIAVLCYQDISDGPDEPSITISPALLRAQIRGRKQGWTFLSVSELLACKERPAELPLRVAVLTFYDGYRSFSAQALPILREEGGKPPWRSSPPSSTTPRRTCLP